MLFTPIFLVVMAATLKLSVTTNTNNVFTNYKHGEANKPRLHNKSAYNEIWTNPYLTGPQKYSLLFAFATANKKELEKKKHQIEQARQKQIDSQNTVYRKYILGRIKSSILKDFMPMRY